MLDPNHKLPLRKQAALLDVPRSSFYYVPVINDDSEHANLIRDVYLKSDCRYGYRKVTRALQRDGEIINGKKALRIMQKINIQGLSPKKFMCTSKQNRNNKVYPYLLEGMQISYVNQVWATDITFIKMSKEFMYFTAIMDIYSRYIVAYELSNNLDSSFCVFTLKKALLRGTPDIFNSDQGSQFTSEKFTTELKNAGVKISMDHKGRCFDNIFVERLWRTVKQEAIYYYRPETIKDLERCLQKFVFWYNNHRLHQSLKYKPPAEVYFNE